MESNVSLNVTYTLKCPGDADSIAELSASGEFSLCGANAYTFSMGFYYTSTDSGVLFAQGNLFTLSILNSKLALNIKNLTNIPIDVGGFFIANAFNNIDITYDRSVVTLYLNGMAAFSKQVTASGAASAQSYIIGAGYSGYVSRVRLADYALTQAEIGANTTENKIDKSHLEFFVDFTNSKPKDAGKHELLLACKHLCESRNIAEVFSFGSKGVISVLQSPPIAQNFSIITKIYIPLAAINDSALLCYNTATEKLTFGMNLPALKGGVSCKRCIIYEVRSARQAARLAADWGACGAPISGRRQWSTTIFREYLLILTASRGGVSDPTANKIKYGSA
ncbi:MAG: LamG domain-containing protein [Spirochaetaceae bacterium]|jgi:hypothetical protein|nr:LamG domain-containing protein [Spirochaetaceae bacterium]